jgi:hypothetical protein
MFQIKNKMIRSLLIIGLITFLGCNESLNIDPTSELETTYFQTEARVQRGVGAAYAALTNIYGAQLGASSGTLHPMWLLPGDDITSDGTGNSFETFAGLNGSNGRVEGIWKRYYAIVSRCNFMLEKFEDPEIQALYVTPGLMDANVGEMLFLRSWSFYKLWDWFHKAPIQDSRIKSIEDALLPPSEGFQMLDNATASLEETATLLPVEWDEKNLGRITKDAAYGLLVKAYAMRANYNSKNVDDYNKAITAFTKMSSNHSLVIPFGNNFDYRKENNAESLFEFQASLAPSGQDNAWLDNDFGGDVGQMGAFYHMFDGHWGNYSSGIVGPTQKLIDAFDPTDPRKAETLSDNANNLDGVLSWITPHWDKFNGYQMVKYINGERGNIYDPIWQISSANNTRILRLADVKLTVAEAYLATGKAGEALKQVNDIRERARKSTPDGTESLEPAALATVTMDDIMHERFLELAGEEGHRWTDLRRWHAAGYINLSSWTAADFGFPSKYDAKLFEFTAPKNLLLPIPTSELDRNPDMAASGQNPGY